MARKHHSKSKHPPSPPPSSAGKRPRRDLRSGAVPANSERPSTRSRDLLPGVLVLNANFEPLNICSLQRGLNLLLLDKAEVVRFSENTLRSADEEHLVPAVVRLHSVVKRPTPQLKISRKSVLARDSYTCVYCGSKESLTIDHVFPRSRGGETTWENVVCSCLKCNNKKGSRTPSECGLRLPTPPRKPRYVPYISFPRFVSAVRRPEWREFLVAYGKGLEER